MRQRTKLLIAAALAWTYGVTFFRTVRPPNDFAEAHWLLDYRFGFVKRGFAGMLLTAFTKLLDIQPSERLIAGVAYTLFAVFAIILFTVSFRLIVRWRWSPAAVLITLVFASSPFIVMSAHLVGYYDHIFILMTVLSCAALVAGQRWLAASLQAGAVLFHESAILVGFPLFCLTWLLVNQRRAGRRQTPLGAAPLMLPVAALAAVALAQTILPSDFESAYASRLAGFAFVGNKRSTLVPDWFVTRIADFYTRKAFIDRLVLSPSIHALVLPSLLAFLCFITDAHGDSVFSTQTLALVGACLAPQALHAVAWDTARIWTYSIVCGFLTVWIYAEAQGARRVPPASVTLIALIAIVLNVFSFTPLMDNERDRLPLGQRVVFYLPTLAAACALVARDRSASVQPSLPQASEA